MFLKVIFITFVLKIFIVAAQQNITCSYDDNVAFGYTCDLYINNPDGFDAFNAIGGAHRVARTDKNVNRINGISVSGQNSLNIPRILCDTFINLRRVSLQSLQITTIWQNTFSACTNLDYLNLDFNNIKNVSVSPFSNNVRLQHLSLFSNQITSISENFFANLRDLIYLSLDYNPFQDIPDTVFRNLNVLKELRLAGCEIYSLKPQWFAALNELEALYLGFNYITELPRDIFSNLDNLKTLWLNNNQIRTIDSISFGGLESYNNINFDHNRINATDYNFLRYTENLKWFYFSNNLCADEIFPDYDSDRDGNMNRTFVECMMNYEREPIFVETNNNSYIWYPIRWVGLRINIMAAYDAHIIISETRNESYPTMEIYIGTEGNRVTKIFRNGLLSASRDTADILSPDEHRNFMLGWYNNLFTFFVGDFPFPIMGDAMSPPFEVHYFGVRTWNTTGDWEIQRIDLAGSGFN